MTQISIPQSVQDYMHQPSVRSAVDYLLEGGTADLPQGLERWEEVRAFHRAYLSACQVRAEHALFLMDLWEAVWGHALAQAPIRLRSLTPAEQYDTTDETPVSPDDIWDNEFAFCRVFETNNRQTRCVGGVICWHDNGLILYLYVYDAVSNISLSDHHSLADPWESEPNDDGYRHTSYGTIPVPTASVFDVTTAQELAVAVINGFPWPTR